MGRRRASVYYILAAWDPEGTLGLVRQSVTVGQARAAGAASVVSDTQQYKTQHVAWAPGLACRRATGVALHPGGRCCHKHNQPAPTCNAPSARQHMSAFKYFKPCTSYPLRSSTSSLNAAGTACSAASARKPYTLPCFRLLTPSKTRQAGTASLLRAPLHQGGPMHALQWRLHAPCRRHSLSSAQPHSPPLSTDPSQACFACNTR